MDPFDTLHYRLQEIDKELHLILSLVDDWEYLGQPIGAQIKDQVNYPCGPEEDG